MKSEEGKDKYPNFAHKGLLLVGFKVYLTSDTNLHDKKAIFSFEVFDLRPLQVTFYF